MDKHLTLTADEAEALKDNYEDPLKQTSVDKKYQSAKPEKISLNNSYILFAILFLLAIFAVGGFLLWNQISSNLKKGPYTLVGTTKVEVQPEIVITQDPTKWQTYSGPFGFTGIGSAFSFKFPPNWQLEPSLNNTQKNFIEDVIANNTSDLSQRYILTIDTVKTDAKSLAEFIASHQSPGDTPNLAIDNFIKDTSVNIPNASWMIDKSVYGEGSDQAAIFLKGNTAVLLTCTHCGLEITNEIIKTFRFTQ